MANTTTAFSDTAEVAARVRQLWITATESGEQSANDTFDNGGGTSLAGLRLISALRAEFGVRMTWQTLRKARNADDLAEKVVAARAGEGSGTPR